MLFVKEIFSRLKKDKEEKTNMILAHQTEAAGNLKKIYEAMSSVVSKDVIEILKDVEKCTKRQRSSEINPRKKSTLVDDLQRDNEGSYVEIRIAHDHINGVYMSLKAVLAMAKATYQKLVRSGLVNFTVYIRAARTTNAGFELETCQRPRFKYLISVLVYEEITPSSEVLVYLTASDGIGRDKKHSKGWNLPQITEIEQLTVEDIVGSKEEFE